MLNVKGRLRMAEYSDWIATRVGAARISHAFMTEAALRRLEDLLKGQLSERQLNPKELAKIAKELIADMMIPTKPNAKENL